ncbi:MAG: putative transposase, partial [Caballeronia mineralivorans]|nr:putative transposase [Caballeronia mineralivorans]
MPLRNRYRSGIFGCASPSRAGCTGLQAGEAERSSVLTEYCTNIQWYAIDVSWLKFARIRTNTHEYARIRTNTLRIAPSREEARTLRVLGERVSRLYNAGNYLCRQAFIAAKPIPSYATLCKRLPVEYEADYRA